MEKIIVGINSQTPLVRFKLQYTELLEKYGELPDPVPLEMLAEGEDHEMAPGGVPKMVFPLLNLMIKKNLVEKAHWVCLNPIGPERVSVGKILIHNISLPPHELSGYTRLKERLWEEAHNLEKHAVGPREFAAYAKYNWLCANKMLELLPVDIFYIHDFQQLQIGNMIGLAGPTVFRWHIPFDLEKAEPYTRNFIVRCMEAFDAIEVSCKRDLEGAIRAGYRGKAYQIFPYIDEKKWSEPSKEELDDFCTKFGISDDNQVVLVVARMDRIKGQDIAIKATAKLIRKFPKLKLILVGDGSFSGSQKGGLFHPKATQWRLKLEQLTRDLGIEKHVVFTGYIPDGLLKAAYTRCDVFVLPSINEGFGLVVPEAWIYKKPVVVSKGAGASEFVIEGVNGYTFEPGNVDELAEKIELVFLSSKMEEMGERGSETARRCYLEEGMKNVYEVLVKTIEEFRGKPT